MILIAAMAATVIIPLSMAPAGATGSVGAGNSGCKANDPTTGFHPGAEIGWYPAWPGSQSAFRAACVFDSATGTSVVSSKFTIHDARNVEYHDGAARTVTVAAPGVAANAAAGTCVPLVDTTGIGAWVNHPISGGTFSSTLAVTMLQARTFETAVDPTGPCTPGITLNLAAGGLGIPAGTVLRIDNTNSRSTALTGCATTTGGSAALTDLCANFEGPWSGAAVAETGDIGGSNVPDYATYTATGPTTATMSAVATNVVAHGVNEAITYRGAVLTSTTRTLNDATCNAATPTIVTSTAGFFNANDVGLPFYGFGAGAGGGYYITAITVGPPSTATVTNAGGAPLPGCPVATATAVTVGDPSVTAPLDDQGVLQQTVQLDLKPAFVAGSNDCALDEAEGFGIVGKWRNPGPGPLPNGFFTSVPFAVQPANSKAIGEILFTTSVVSYAAFVVEREATSPALVPAEPSVPNQHHYDIVFPNVPTSLALCASATSPGLGFSIGINSTTVSQAGLASGLGKPGTAQLRNTNPIPAPAAVNTTAYVYDDNNPRLWVPASRFNRLCALPAGTPSVNFVCGDG